MCVLLPESQQADTSLPLYLNPNFNHVHPPSYFRYFR